MDGVVCATGATAAGGYPDASPEPDRASWGNLGASILLPGRERGAHPPGAPVLARRGVPLYSGT